LRHGKLIIGGNEASHRLEPLKHELLFLGETLRLNQSTKGLNTCSNKNNSSNNSTTIQKYVCQTILFGALALLWHSWLILQHTIDMPGGTGTPIAKTPRPIQLNYVVCWLFTFSLANALVLLGQSSHPRDTMPKMGGGREACI